MSLFMTCIELFLFVNPLGSECYETGKTIMHFSKEREENIRIRFVPLLNFYTFGEHMKKQKLKGTSLQIRNQLYKQSYHASLAFQAASMQGKKKGRQFLLGLQRVIIECKRDFSKATLFDVAEQVKLDLDMFEEDLESDLIKNTFSKDQKLAQEMAITRAPSCVIQCPDQPTGYRIETAITKQLLHGLCDEKKEELLQAQKQSTKQSLQMVESQG